MGRPYGRLLPILFFALLAVVLIPAATAQAACSVVGQPCVRDDFEQRLYNLNTGTDDWATNWEEDPTTDGGPTLGVMLVAASLPELRFQGVSGTDETDYAISRDVYIPPAATAASLVMKIGFAGSSVNDRELVVEVSDGGVPAVFEVLASGLVPNPQTLTRGFGPIPGGIAGKTFTVSLTNASNLADAPEYWYIDFVEVYYNSPLAVTLADFRAEQAGDHVLVTWETASELDNQGFNLYRSTSDAAPETQLNATLIPSQSPGSAAGFLYTWEDRDGLTPGATYYYWLEDVSLSGATTLHGPVSVTFTGPTAVTLDRPARQLQ